MFRAFHPSGLETVTELDSTDSGYREDGVGDQRLNRIEKRLTKTCRHTGDPALDYSSQRITVPGGSFQKGIPFRLVGLSPDFNQTGLKDDSRTHFLGNNPSGDQRKGYPAGEMSASTRVVESVPLDRSHIVSVTGTRHRLKSFIIRGSSVVISEYDR